MVNLDEFDPKEVLETYRAMYGQFCGSVTHQMKVKYLGKVLIIELLKNQLTPMRDFLEAHFNNMDEIDREIRENVTKFLKGDFQKKMGKLLKVLKEK